MPNPHKNLALQTERAECEQAPETVKDIEDQIPELFLLKPRSCS